MYTYLRIMNIHTTGKATVHDTDVFDIDQVHGSIMRFIGARCWTTKLVLRVKWKVTSCFTFPLKYLNFMPGFVDFVIRAY